MIQSINKEFKGHNKPSMKPIIYVINIDASVDRLNATTERLAAQDITFTRISAVVGKELSEEEISRHYSKDLNKRKYYKDLTPAQIGCFLSHREAWKRIAEGEGDWGIVLEDDFNVIGDINLAIETINNLKVSWQLIKLAAYQSRERKVAFSTPVDHRFNLVVHKKPMSGGAATAITKQAAKQLLSATEKFGRPCDTELQHFWETKVKVMSLMPYVIEQDMTFESTISAKKIRRKKRIFGKVIQQSTDLILNSVNVHNQVTELRKDVENLS